MTENIPLKRLCTLFSLILRLKKFREIKYPRNKGAAKIENALLNWWALLVWIDYITNIDNVLIKWKEMMVYFKLGRNMRYIILSVTQATRKKNFEFPQQESNLWPSVLIKCFVTCLVISIRTEDFSIERFIVDRQWHIFEMVINIWWHFREI